MPGTANDTSKFRLLGRPECELQGGVQFGNWFPMTAIGTTRQPPRALPTRGRRGPASATGSKVSGLVGFEYDSFFPDCDVPGTPQILFAYQGPENSAQFDSAAVKYIADGSGARVFSSGSEQWSWGLDSYRWDPTLFTGIPPTNAPVQQFTRNMLADAVDPAPPAGVNATVSGASIQIDTTPRNDPQGHLLQDLSPRRHWCLQAGGRRRHPRLPERLGRLHRHSTGRHIPLRLGCRRPVERLERRPLRRGHHLDSGHGGQRLRHPGRGRQRDRDQRARKRHAVGVPRRRSPRGLSRPTAVSRSPVAAPASPTSRMPTTATTLQGPASTPSSTRSTGARPPPSRDRQLRGRCAGGGRRLRRPHGGRPGHRRQCARQRHRRRRWAEEDQLGHAAGPRKRCDHRWRHQRALDGREVSAGRQLLQLRQRPGIQWGRTTSSPTR